MANLGLNKGFQDGNSTIKVDDDWLNTVATAVQAHEDALPDKIDKSVGTTKGDLAVFNGVAWVRIARGTNGQALLADSSTSSGLRYGTVAAEGGGGAVGNLTLDGDGFYVVDDDIIDGGAP